jgi:hypothetical protein
LKFIRLSGKGAPGKIKMYYKKQQLTLLFFGFCLTGFQVATTGREMSR